jgi:hypothetical protein
MIFGVETIGDDSKINTAMESFNNNMQTKTLTQYLFKGKMFRINKTTSIVDIEYLLPMPTIILLIGVAVGVLFGIDWISYVCGGLVAVILILESKFFYFIMMKQGMRKLGYDGNLRLLSNTETIRRILKVKKILG